MNSIFGFWVLTTICYNGVSIKIVADCGLQTCQVTRTLKRASTLEFTTITAIILYAVIAMCFSNFVFL